jgi:CBS domain-containing protein
MLQSRVALPEHKAADIMQRNVVTFQPDVGASQAARLLYEHGITGAPVIEFGKVIGFVSASDIMRLVAYGPKAELPADAADDHAREPTVRDLMMPATFRVEPGTTLPKLASFLLHAGVHRALVMDGDQLVGIVSATDVLRAVAGEWPTPADRR